MTIVQPYDIWTHLGLRLEPDNMAHIAPRPKPQVTFKTIEQMIFINSYHTTPQGSHPVICFPNKKVIARLYCLSVARQYRGLPLLSIPTEMGTISKATLTTSHSHLSTHIRLRYWTSYCTNSESNHNPSTNAWLYIWEAKGRAGVVERFWGVLRTESDRAIRV